MTQERNCNTVNREIESTRPPGASPGQRSGIAIIACVYDDYTYKEE